MPGQVVSREEYHRWRDARPRGRYERVDGRVVAMAPERIGHVRVKGAVWLALRRAIGAAGLACEALADGVTVQTGDSDFEPDAVVHCGPELPEDAIAASHPVIVVEVLSPGTAAVDTGAKLAGYFQVPSVAHYLIVHPARRVVIRHRRNGVAIATRLVASGAIEMDPPGLSIELAAFFDPT